jgi:hypothetical protein
MAFGKIKYDSSFDLLEENFLKCTTSNPMIEAGI